jgi:hypothetical protein
MEWDGQEWSAVHNSTGPPPAAHHGQHKAFISLYCPSETGHGQGLFTPVFDLSEVENPVLSFCHLALGPAFIAVWYKNTADSYWIPLQVFSWNIMDWQREIIPLPDKSNHYQIVFVGHHYGGGYGELHLDNISITDGEPELSISSNFKDNFSVAPNPVHDYVTISGIHPQMVTIYDAQGRKILTETDHTNRINMAHFQKGLYFLHIISDTGTVHVQKVIKH